MAIGEYPHLDDTVFPGASNVDVYKFENTYDYSKWSDNVKVKLCNVPWESDGKHAVKFADDKARDSWFDNLKGDEVDMQTMFHTLPSKCDIRMPLPYDVCISYNYVRVQVPVMPNAGQPLEYADAPNRYAYQHWFIMDIDTYAPNTTKLTVMRDWWTDFVNHVEISHMMLERGHAPMTMDTPETFLKDPLNNTMYLGAPDVDYGGTSIVKDQRYAPIGAGEKWILFFTNMEQADFTSSRKIQYIGDWNSSITRSDSTVDDREFQNYDINWDWDYGNFTYRDSSHHATTAFTDHRANRVSNNVGVVAVKASDVHQERGDDGADFLNCMRDTYPQWFQTLFGICNVSRDMIELSDHKKVTLNHLDSDGSVQVHEFDVYRAVPQSSELLDLKLTPEMFGMPEEYGKITKLYTDPYSHIEVVNESGNVTTIRVEDVHSSLRLQQRPITSFPWVTMTAFLRGVGGDASSISFTWENLGGTESTFSCYGDMWKNTIMQYDIPVFSVYQSEYDKYRLDHYSSALENGKYVATHNYESAVDSAETAHFNVKGNGGHEFADDTFSNDKASGADVGSSYTSQEDAYASAKAARMNARDSADVAEANTNNSNTASRSNATTARTASQNNAIITSNSSVNMTGYNLARALNDVEAQKIYIDGIANLDIAYVTGMQINTGENNVANTAIGGMSGLAGGAIVGASGGAPGAVAGAAVGAIVSVAHGAVNTETAYEASNLLIDKTSAGIALNQGILTRKNNNAVNTAQNNSVTMHGMYPRITGSGLNHTFGGTASDRVGNVENGANYLTADNSAAAMQTQTNRTANASDANAARSKALVKGGTYDGTTYLGTAMRSEDASQWIAKNDRHLANFNANKTQNSQTRNALRDAENARQTAIAGYRDAHRQGQVKYGEYRGEAQWDALRMRGVQFRIMRQSDGAIAAAGDQMLRYGYMYDRAWRFDGFNLMAHFTFWQCSDVWLTARSDGMAEDAQDRIKEMLYKGVTVWNNPDDIGAYSIYQNWGE